MARLVIVDQCIIGRFLVAQRIRFLTCELDEFSPRCGFEHGKILTRLEPEPKLLGRSFGFFSNSSTNDTGNFGSRDHMIAAIRGYSRLPSEPGSKSDLFQRLGANHPRRVR